MAGMKQRMRTFGFTLMEVNLAIFIMATGVLAMVALYPLGYRESQQSRDDVWAAAEADRVFNILHATLGERNMKWNDWLSTVDASSSTTWADYCDQNKGYAPKKRGACTGAAKAVLDALVGKASKKPAAVWFKSSDYAYAVVAQPGFVKQGVVDPKKDYSRIVVSMRVARNAATLFAQPIFLTEIHFQGDQEKMGN